MEKEEIEVISLWDSKAEQLVFDTLREKINLDFYQINKHISLKEIFKKETKAPWMECHIDLLITDLKDYPVLGIEINGIRHWNESEYKKRDREKKEIFAEAGVPLVCIPLPELPSYTKEEYKTNYAKALSELLDKFLLPFYYKTSYPIYCRMCGQQLEQKFKNDYTGSFYCCSNKKCKFKTISAEKIPNMFKLKKESYEEEL